MPFTNGNDTVSLTFDGTVIDGTIIDGLAGDDLLIFAAPAAYLGRQTYYVEARMPGGGGFLGLGFSQYSPFASVGVIISGVERLDISTPLGAFARLTTGSSNDTLRGADQDDVLAPGAGANYVYGGGGRDLINLVPGGGIDRVQAGSGDDTITGAELDDFLDGGAGFDRLAISFASSTGSINIDAQAIAANTRWRNFEAVDIDLTAGNDTLRITDFNGYYRGMGGNDLLIIDRTGLGSFLPDLSNIDHTYSGFSQIQFIGGAFDDRMKGGYANDTLWGGDGNDTLIGLDGADRIYGGAGNDILDVFGSRDTVDGGDGFDIAVVNFSQVRQGITLGLGHNPENWSGIESYLGVLTRGNDVYYTSLLSTAGTPYVGTGTFVQYLSGGRGTDLLVFDYSVLGSEWTGTVVDMRPGFSQNVIQNSVSGAVTCRVADWEMIDYTGSRYADWVFGATGDDTIRGGDGNDTLDGGPGSNLLYGGNGDDVISAAHGTALRAYGGDGDDAFSFFDAASVIDGGLGRDTVTVNLDRSDLTSGVTLTQRGVGNLWSGIEAVNGTLTRLDDVVRIGAMGTGNGTLSGGLGQDALILDYSALDTAVRLVADSLGDYETVTVFFSDGTSTVGRFSNFESLKLSGTGGDDLISPWNMVARLFGNGGNDTISGSNLSDTIYGGKGDDSIVGRLGNDIIQGDEGNDTIYGGNEFRYTPGSDNDILRGGAGDDLIIGYGGNDLILGEDGNDAMAGGEGNDQLLGGFGSDLFFFEGWTNTGTDRISDYVDGLDFIWISGGLTLSNVTLRDIGADKMVTWADGSVLLEGMAGLTIYLYFDADFV